jgi:glycerol-3-phosphate dehydrogenase
MKRFDVTILGGGIAGLGVADASLKRGLSTLVLEAHSTAHAASNNTLRIIHGGFRYLQQLNIGRVVRSLNDQSYVVQTFPEAVAPLPCLMPLARSGLKSRWPVTAAALLYGAIMRTFRSPLPTPRILSAKDLRALAPELASLAPRGALCWHDVVMIDPSRIHTAMRDQIRSRGGELHEHTKVTSISKSSDGFRVRTANNVEFETTRVINTLGAWLGSVSVPEELKGPRPTWCLGFNLIVSKQLHPTHACGVQSPDGRLFFCVPRGLHTAIGTWYIPYPHSAPTSEDGIKPTVPEGAIDEFIRSFNAALPSFQINRPDILDIDAGILPMKTQARTGPELYGSEIISCSRGYCEVISTKYTTFRSQGVRALRAVLRKSR